VFPIAVDVDRILHARPVPALEKWLNDGLTNFLFVGRMAPNKRIEDIVRLAEHYKRYVDAHYRFIFVGRYEGMPRYFNMVRALIAELGWLPDRFVFTGPVPDDELAAYYRAASVYISMSEHEGFCVPLIEAMAADLPVLAYACTAVPDTLGGAGVQFSPKDFEAAAELLGSLAFDDGLRAGVIEGQRRRLADFVGDRMDREVRQLAERFQ
jgi:glycosyltransferase involved in cell wall biosynthesis